MDEVYRYGAKPTDVQIEKAIDTLKSERFAWWLPQLTNGQREDIEEAHNIAIYILTHMPKD